MKNKGQNLIEYALLLAIVVGIGWMLLTPGGLQSSVGTIFSSAGNLLGTQSEKLNEQAEEQKRQEADYANAEKMKETAQKAIQNQGITFPNGSGGYIDLILRRNGDKVEIDGAADNGQGSYNNVMINGKPYGGPGGWKAGLWNYIKSQSGGTIAQQVNQQSNDWYAVRVYQDGTAYYYTGTEAQYKAGINGGGNWVSGSGVQGQKMK